MAIKAIGDIQQAAEFYCAAQIKLRQLARSRKRCSGFCRADYSAGDPGQDACDLKGPTDELCAECANRVAQYPTYQAALKERAAAKRKMMRIYSGLVKGCSLCGGGR